MINGVDWGGHVHPTFFRIDFNILLNPIKIEWGDFFLSQHKDRHSFPLVYNAMTSRSRLVYVAYSQMGIRAVRDVESMMSTIFILS